MVNYSEVIMFLWYNSAMFQLLWTERSDLDEIIHVFMQKYLFAAEMYVTLWRACEHIIITSDTPQVSYFWTKSLLGTPQIR